MHPLKHEFWNTLLGDKTKNPILNQIHTDAVFLQDVSRPAIWKLEGMQCWKRAVLHFMSWEWKHPPVKLTKRQYDDCDAKVVNDRTLVEDLKF